MGEIDGSDRGVLWCVRLLSRSAILRLRRDYQLQAAVLDSPFTDLKLVAEELAGGGVHVQIPQLVVSKVCLCFACASTTIFGIAQNAR